MTQILIAVMQYQLQHFEKKNWEEPYVYFLKITFGGIVETKNQQKS